MKGLKEPKLKEPEFEEIITRCSVCGKKMKMVKYKGITAEVWLCQKCGKGEAKVE